MSTSLSRRRRLIAAKRLPQMQCVECGISLARVFSPVRHLQRHVDAERAAITQRAAAP